MQASKSPFQIRKTSYYTICYIILHYLLHDVFTIWKPLYNRVNFVDMATKKDNINKKKTARIHAVCGEWF